jgi:hypothetical protein
MQTTSAQRIQAVISRFGKIQQSSYPPYARVQSVLFTWQNGPSAQEVWKTFPAEEAQLFKVGQPAFLSSRTGRNNQVIWEVEFIGGTAAASPPPAATQTAPAPAQLMNPLPAQFPSQPVSHQAPAPAPQPNQDIAHWIQNQAQLYAHCFGSAAQALTAYEVSEETIRAAASTLFISASRKFNLER